MAGRAWSWRRPPVALGRRLLGSLDGRPALRSALFRFVDAAPPAAGRVDRGAHLRAFVREVDGERSRSTLRPLRARGRPRPPLAAYGLASGPATALLARQFIAGRDVTDATGNLRRCGGGARPSRSTCWARRRSPRPRPRPTSSAAPRRSAGACEVTRDWPDQPLLDADPHGRCRAPTSRSSSRRSPRCCARWPRSAAPPTPPAACGRCCGWRASSGPTSTWTWRTTTAARRCSWPSRRCWRRGVPRGAVGRGRGSGVPARRRRDA